VGLSWGVHARDPRGALHSSPGVLSQGRGCSVRLTQGQRGDGDTKAGAGAGAGVGAEEWGSRGEGVTAPTGEAAGVTQVQRIRLGRDSAHLDMPGEKWAVRGPRRSGAHRPSTSRKRGTGRGAFFGGAGAGAGGAPVHRRPPWTCPRTSSACTVSRCAPAPGPTPTTGRTAPSSTRGRTRGDGTPRLQLQLHPLPRVPQGRLQEGGTTASTPTGSSSAGCTLHSTARGIPPLSWNPPLRILNLCQNALDL